MPKAVGHKRSHDADEVEARLSSGAMHLLGPLPRSSNGALLVEIADCGAGATRKLLAVYKPARSERPLWDFPRGTLCLREAAAYRVSKYLGWNLVPPTVLRDGPAGPGVVQLFVKGRGGTTLFRVLESGSIPEAMVRIFAFDVVVNNADRKAGHCIFSDDGSVWSVDHGTCFHEDFKLRTVLWDLGGASLSPKVMADLKRLAAAIGRTVRSRRASEGEGSEQIIDLGDLLSRCEIEAVLRRTESLLERGRLPDGGKYADIPWPPV